MGEAADEPVVGLLQRLFGVHPQMPGEVAYCEQHVTKVVFSVHIRPAVGEDLGLLGDLVEHPGVVGAGETYPRGLLRYSVDGL